MANRSAFSVYSEMDDVKEECVTPSEAEQNAKPKRKSNSKNKPASKKLEFPNDSKNKKTAGKKSRKDSNALKNNSHLNGTLDKKQNKITKTVQTKKNEKQKKPTEEKISMEKSRSKHISMNSNDSPMCCHNHDKNSSCMDEEIIPAYDSKMEALELFKYIIHPIKLDDFFKKHWEKKPLLVKRKNPEHYKDWFSCKEFNKILRQKNLDFTQNIDVTTYINGIKEKHNPEGRAYAPLVWDFFQQGCSIRLLNPQTYSNAIWKYLSLLQEIFYTSVGSNIYLTPAGCQGFAPHYDDIEAFALQLEGKKRWRVYKPIDESQVLPFVSSRNFTQEEIGEPIIDCVLEPGDLLYFPRGFIHQAIACDDVHSLHITVSCYQNNTYGHFLAKLLPAAVDIAMGEDKEYREGMPVGYPNYGGVATAEVQYRKKFVQKIMHLAEKIVHEYLPIDATVDQVAKKFIHESLPPHLEKTETIFSIHGNGEKWNAKKKRVDCVTEISPDTNVKFIRKDSVRLVMEENSCRLYYNMENSRIYQEKEPQYLEVDEEALPVLMHLFKAYPDFTRVEDLPLDTIDEKVTVVSCLYDKGLIMTDMPLQFDFEG